MLCSKESFRHNTCGSFLLELLTNKQGTEYASNRSDHYRIFCGNNSKASDARKRSWRVHCYHIVGHGWSIISDFSGTIFWLVWPKCECRFSSKHCRSYSDIVFVSDHCQTRGKKNTSSHLFAIINHSFLAMHPFAFSVSL